MNEFDNVVERRGTDSSKWGKYKDVDVLPFWVADMDFRAPQFIRDALQRRLDHGIFGYSDTPLELTHAAVARLDAEFSWSVNPEWLVWIPGVVTGMNLACRAVGATGDSVMMNVPVYYPFLSVPGNGARNAIEVPLVLNGPQWEMDLAAMGDAIDNRTRLFMFCNPQNPTGRIYRREELVELARFCERHDLLICSDEIHCDLRLDADRPHIPIATLSEEIAARTITLMAPTKSYNTPRCAAASATHASDSCRTSAHWPTQRRWPLTKIRRTGWIACARISRSTATRSNNAWRNCPAFR
jgi:cystathionine beta-lyase